jgi:hypothetical protein
MKSRLVGTVVLFSLLAATEVVAAAPSGSRQAGPARLPFTPSFASVANDKSGCTASLTCPNGSPISCSSGVPSTCTVGTNFVDCNGARTNCPTTCYIEKQCCNGDIVACEGSTPTSCSFAAGGVKCDGFITPCVPRFCRDN